MSSLPADRFACEHRNQSRRTIAAKEEPGHTADTEPAGESHGKSADDAHVEALLRHPWSDGIYQLTIQEQHLEHGDHRLDENHRDDLPVLAALDRIVEGLNAGEAAADEH